MMLAESSIGLIEREAFQEPRGQEARMFESSKSKSGPRARRGRRSGSRRRRSRSLADAAADDFDPALDSLDDSLLSEDERTYREARRLANEKVELSRKALRAALITVPLLIFVPFLGVIALILFGIDLGRRVFQLFYEPQLRERFLQEEVQRRVQSRVSRERRQLEGEHHRTLEQLSASIAHEIRNPITAAKSLVQQMGENPGDPDQAEYARVAASELERVERSISHLLRFAREEETQIESITMQEVVESALETFRDRSARSGIRIERRFDVAGDLEGDPEQLRRVVINLVGNAMSAVEEAGVERPEIEVSLGENLARTEVWLRIVDNGFGMDDATRARIFDPFFTSREEGTGLGLALARKIVEGHRGTIEVASAPGEGTGFLLTFPKAGPPSSPKARIR
jgi:signal transduction histidine kinase